MISKDVSGIRCSKHPTIEERSSPLILGCCSAAPMGNDGNDEKDPAGEVNQPRERHVRWQDMGGGFSHERVEDEDILWHHHQQSP